jgi:hypothetical protein
MKLAGMKLLTRKLSSLQEIGRIREPLRTMSKFYMCLFFLIRQVFQLNNLLFLCRLVFIDGSWLFYSLEQGRDKGRVPLTVQVLGDSFQQGFEIDYLKLPYIIAQELLKQMKKQYSLRDHIEVIRSSVFMSVKEKGDNKMELVSKLRRSNFDMHM